MSLTPSKFDLHATITKQEERIKHLEAVLKVALHQIQYYGYEAVAVNFWNAADLQPPASVGTSPSAGTSPDDVAEAVLARAMPPKGEKRELPRRAAINEPCKQCPDCGEYCACYRSHPDQAVKPRDATDEAEDYLHEHFGNGYSAAAIGDLIALLGRRRTETTLPAEVRLLLTELRDACLNATTHECGDALLDRFKRIEALLTGGTEP